MERHSACILLTLVTITLLVSFTSADNDVSIDVTPWSNCLEHSLSNVLSSSKRCSNTTIELPPGEHTLDTELTVKNTLKVEIHPASQSTVIVCKGSGTITFENISRVHIRDVVFVGCTGIQITLVDELIVENCRFRGPAKAADSAVTLTQISSAQIIETSFTSYDNVKNGVLSVYGCHRVFIKRSNFRENAAIMSGGSIHEEGNGGCVYSNNSIVDISDSTFIGNTAEGWAGGCLYASYSDIKIAESTFINNTALKNHGGALCVTWSSIHIADCNFNGNSALKERGGVLFGYYDNDITVTGSTFRGNTAQWYGGSIYTYQQNDVSITDSTFIENIAKSGGALYIHYYGNVNIKDNTFVRNAATFLYGGAVYLQKHYTTTLEGCTFRENKAQLDGGGVYTYDSVNVTIASCTFTKNTAARNGGGVGSYNGNSVDIRESEFTKNDASENGRCIFSQLNTATRIDTATRNSISKDPGCFYEIE